MADNGPQANTSVFFLWRMYVEMTLVPPSTTIYSNSIPEETGAARTINQAVKETVRIAHSSLIGPDGVLSL